MRAGRVLHHRDPHQRPGCDRSGDSRILARWKVRSLSFQYGVTLAAKKKEVRTPEINLPVIVSRRAFQGSTSSWGTGRCGSEQASMSTARTTADKMYCMACGTSIPRAANFCLECGSENLTRDGAASPKPKRPTSRGSSTKSCQLHPSSG